jgi:hypothetical protein
MSGPRHGAIAFSSCRFVLRDYDAEARPRSLSSMVIERAS